MGLLHSQLTNTFAHGLYKDKGVMTDIGKTSYNFMKRSLWVLGESLVTWSQWDKLIQESFERHFHFIYNALKPNFPIAMTVVRR